METFAVQLPILSIDLICMTIVIVNCINVRLFIGTKRWKFQQNNQRKRVAVNKSKIKRKVIKCKSIVRFCRVFFFAMRWMCQLITDANHKSQISRILIWQSLQSIWLTFSFTNYIVHGMIWWKKMQKVIAFNWNESFQFNEAQNEIKKTLYI